MIKPPTRITIRSQDKDMESLTLCFTEDGEIHFYPITKDPVALAENIGRFVTMVYENPVLLRHIAFTGLKVDTEFSS